MHTHSSQWAHVTFLLNVAPAQNSQLQLKNAIEVHQKKTLVFTHRIMILDRETQLNMKLNKNYSNSQSDRQAVCIACIKGRYRPFVLWIIRINWLNSFAELLVVQLCHLASFQALQRATAEKRTSPFSLSINSRHTLAASYRETSQIIKSVIWRRYFDHWKFIRETLWE